MMVFRWASVVLAGITATTLHTTAGATDARALGIGNAAVSSSYGANATFQNPASLLTQSRDGQKFNFAIGFGAEIRDDGDVIRELADNENLIDDLESEIDTVSQQNLTCTPLDAADTTCLTNTLTLGDLANQVLSLFNTADSSPIEGSASGSIAMSFPQAVIPVAFGIKVSVTGSGFSDISDADQDYVQTIANALSDNALTLGEIVDSAPLTFNVANNTVDIALPDDVLTSEASGGAVMRIQFAASAGFELDYAGYAFDVGVTPKISQLTAGNLETAVRDIDSADELRDQIEDSENSETTFTVDVGVMTELPQLPGVELGGVIRNLIPESVESNNGVKFETTPQLILGATYSKDWYTFSGDLALNSAELDGLETHAVGTGVIVGNKMFNVRAGLRHDFAIEQDPTSFSLGVGLGFIELGARFNGDSSGEFAAQVAFGL